MAGCRVVWHRMCFRGHWGLDMSITNNLNELGPSYSDDALADSTYLSMDETDDLEEFPVLLQSGDVRDLIEIAGIQGLSATGRALRLVRGFLRRTRGAVLVGDVPSSGRHS